MTKRQIKIGLKVKTNRDFYGWRKGTVGYIIEDYELGITVGWDLPQKRFTLAIASQFGFDKIAKLPIMHPNAPAQDGFSYEELKYLDVVGIDEFRQSIHNIIDKHELI